MVHLLHRLYGKFVSDKSDNSSNNQPQVAQQNSLTEDDNDCAMSNLQTQPVVAGLPPILMLKWMHQIQRQRTHTWILVIQMRIQAPVSQMTQHCL